jgi:hypothetical protein
MLYNLASVARYKATEETILPDTINIKNLIVHYHVNAWRQHAHGKEAFGQVL